jgi:xanthosine utilization system XapX-like protein
MVLSGGMVGFMFALLAVRTWPGVAFLEVFLVMGATVGRHAKARKHSNEPAQAGGL